MADARIPKSRSLRLNISLDRPSDSYLWTVSVNTVRRNVPSVQVFEQGRMFVPSDLEDCAPLEVVLQEAAVRASLRL